MLLRTGQIEVRDSVKISWVAILLAGTALAYTGLFLSLSSEPFTDAPNHLARAAIMGSLFFDAHSPYQGMFSVSHTFMPYMLPDLGMVLAIRVLGFNVACPVWSTLTMLALVFAVWFYARQKLTTSWAIAAAVLCSWYFATNYLFTLGFFSFQWGVAAAFVALAAIEGWRKAGSPGWIALYAGACFACYGAHLACFAMLAAIVAVVGAIRVFLKEQSGTRLAWELLPFAVLAGYHLLLVPAHPFAGKVEHSTVGDKFGHFFEALFVRENYVIERSVLVFFWGMVVVAIWFGLRRKVEIRAHWQLAAICGLAAAIYFVLPFGLAGVYYVDERALPFFYIPLLLLALRFVEGAEPGRDHMGVVMACALLAAANLGALLWFLPRQNTEIAWYREALLQIPAGKKVLPIYTRHRDGNTYPLRHAASFYAVDRESYIPYLFSQENASGPAGYFSDLSPIYRPPQGWYMSRAEPDWEKIARTYDYVVITKPWSVRRIDLSRMKLYYQNSVVSVFRVRRR